MLDIQLSDFIKHHQFEGQKIILALSGGLDSMVLLHLLSVQREQLPAIEAIHINHQLQNDATSWAEFCQRQCQQWAIPFSNLRVEVADDSGEGVEATARKARYQALAQRMRDGDILLTAHHADDQAETLLLQLFRGSGVEGTAAMPEIKAFAAGVHARPLLHIRRAQLQIYAQQQQLQWVEDPSNQDVHFDRNFLRQSILPQLSQRWPGLIKNLGRVAQNHADTLRVFNAYLHEDLQHFIEADGRLRWQEMQDMSASKQGQLLRIWIKQQGHRVPSRKVLQRLQEELFTPREDATPEVLWGDSMVHRYRQHLYLEPRQGAFDKRQILAWNTRESLCIGELGCLQMQQVDSGGMPLQWRECEWQVRFRQGGESVQREGESQHLQVKKLLQDAGIPPWQRERLPLLYCDNELVFIPGVFQKQRLDKNKSGILPVWQPFSTMN